MRVAIIVGLALCLCGCGGERLPKLTVYSAGPRPLAEFAAREFTEATGIEVNLFAATSGQLMAKLEAEKYNPRADVIIVASQVAADALAMDGRLLAYQPDYLGELRVEWNHPEGLYLGSAAASVGVAFRAEAAPDALRWADFFEGKVPGRVLMPSPSRSGTSGDFVLAWLQQRGSDGWQDFAKAKAEGLEFAGANNQAITNLLIGSHDALLGAVDYLIYAQIARGEPLVMRFPEEGALIVPRPMAIMAETRHAEAARRFVDVYLSEAVQQEAANRHLLPARKSVSLSEVRADAGVPKALPFDAAAEVKDQRAVMRRFQYEIERAVVPR